MKCHSLGRTTALRAVTVAIALGACLPARAAAQAVLDWVQPTRGVSIALDAADNLMAAENFDSLLTAGTIAKTLGASDAKVKKAIKDLGLQPAAKKGVCAYYRKDVLPKVKGALAKALR